MNFLKAFDTYDPSYLSKNFYQFTLPLAKDENDFLSGQNVTSPIIWLLLHSTHYMIIGSWE